MFFFDITCINRPYLGPSDRAFNRTNKPVMTEKTVSTPNDGKTIWLWGSWWFPGIYTFEWALIAHSCTPPVCSPHDRKARDLVMFVSFIPCTMDYSHREMLLQSHYRCWKSYEIPITIPWNPYQIRHEIPVKSPWNHHFFWGSRPAPRSPSTKFFSLQERSVQSGSQGAQWPLNQWLSFPSGFPYEAQVSYSQYMENHWWVIPSVSIFIGEFPLSFGTSWDYSYWVLSRELDGNWGNGMMIDSYCGSFPSGFPTKHQSWILFWIFCSTLWSTYNTNIGKITMVLNRLNQRNVNMAIYSIANC